MKNWKYGGPSHGGTLSALFNNFKANNNESRVHGLWRNTVKFSFQVSTFKGKVVCFAARATCIKSTRKLT